MAFVDITGDSTVDAWPTVRARRGRRRFAALTILTSLALIAGLVFLAVNADGREVSRASSNDGGAWLVNRELAVVGHKNRAAGEISASIRVADSPTADIFQASGIVVVYDAATGQLLEVDERAFAEDQQPTQLPEFASVMAIDEAVLVVRSEPLSVWQIDVGTLRSIASLDGIAPLASSTGAGHVAATPDGVVVVLDLDGSSLRWFRNGIADGEPIALDLGADVVDLAVVEQSAVVLLSNGDLIVVDADATQRLVAWESIAGESQRIVRLQQSSGASSSQDLSPARAVVGVTAESEIVRVALAEAPTLRVLARLDAGSPLAPIVHNGCVHSVATNPPVYGVLCDRFVSRPLAGASQELRLRLVNGVVWVNDLEDGGTWVTNDDLEVERIDDWSLAAETESNASDTEDDGGGDDDGGDDLVIEDPDAVGEVQSSDEFNLTEENVAPVAVDDEASTRVDRTTVIDVLANDSDANNDILVVASAELTAGDARVTVTPSGEEVQVTPAAGFVGRIELTYSISDGESDPVSATVRVEVLPEEGANTAPLTTTDVVSTAPGNATTIDVLYNDVDAEGDALALVSIETETGSLRWDPTGQITFTPDNNTEAGWIELPYVVRDDRGAESAGLLRVEIRDQGANQEPDARNDHASTIVGRPVVVQLLANDSDPDGDPLIVGSRPVLLEPQDAVVRASNSPDGEFVFAADVAGTYLFSYTVTDSAVGGSESDTARIRIDVVDNPVNEPPIAVRDDVVIPVAGTRTVYALQNDGDPAGDVVAIVDWQPAEGLSILEFSDGTGVVGFQITALPGAAAQVSFNYWISDGVNDPVSAPVVVAVVDQLPTDQPPFAVDDVVEARAGSTVARWPVLANDFDPEGGFLRVVSVSSTDDASVAIAPDGQSLSVDIPEDVVASFSVTYDIEDQAGNRAAAIARVQLLPADAVNRPPTARTDEGRIQQGTAASIDVLRNDSDPDADLVALEGIVEQPAHGTARVSADGIVVYEPDDGFVGTDHIRYAIVDAEGDRDVGDIFIGVMEPPPANRPPIANDDAYELSGVQATNPLDVLTNDSDPDGDPIRVISVTQPDVGSTAINSFGGVDYMAPDRLAEPTSAVFSYAIADNAGNRDTATVTVTMDPFEIPPTPEPLEQEELLDPEVTPEPEIAPEPTPEPTPEVEPDNEPPVAVNDDRGPVAAGTQVVVEVLENDFDPDGPWADLRLLEVGAGGVLEGNTVLVVAGEEDVVVSYTIADAFGAEASAEIRLFVTENQAPVVEPLEVATEYETSITLDLAAQATDIDADDLFFGCCENIRGGSIENIRTDANVLTLTFVPDDRFIGGAGFSYSADDQKGHQTAGSVSIDVRAPGNRPPVIVDDSIAMPQDTLRRVDLAELATDPDGDDLIFRIIEQPSSAVVVEIDGDTAVIDVGASVPVGVGPVLIYEAFDGLLSTRGRIEIEVTPIGNEPPVTREVEVQVPAGASDVINLALSTTDVDAGDPTTWSLDDESFGPLRVELSGSSVQIFAPADGAGEVVEIGYTATDSRGDSASSIVTVTVVEPTAPVPVAINDEASTRAGQQIFIDVLANDFDPLGEGLTLTSATTDTGTAEVDADRILFIPTGAETGEAVITYTIADAAGRPATAVASVTVAGRPDQPAPPDVTAGNEQILIEWETPNRNGAELLGYRITLIEDGVETVETVPVQNSFRWERLENGVEYTVTVIAFNEVDDSDPSEPSLPVTPNLVPEVPAPPQVEFGDGFLRVSWEPPADNGGTPANRYQLEIGGALSDVIPIGDRTSHTWRDLENGEEYNFRVSAGNDAGFSDFSAASPTEHPETTPGAPTITSVERGTASGSLVISWTAPTDDGGGTIDNYRVIPSIGDPVETGEDDPSYPWLDLENGETYTFEVQAHNRAGWSTVTSAASVPAIPCGAPDAPAWVSVDRLDGAARLVFSEPNPNGCGLEGYIITSTNVVTGETLVRNTQLTTFPFGGATNALTNGDRYTFEVRATNAFGTGDPSVASPEVIPAGPPICSTASANVTAVPTDVGEITVSWGAALANGRDIDYYEVDRGTGFQPLPDARLTEPFGGLTNGSTHNYDVRAVNEVGTSPTCGSASATTWDMPTPLAASYTWDASTQQLDWVITGGTSDIPITSWSTTLTGHVSSQLTCDPDGTNCFLVYSSNGFLVDTLIDEVGTGPLPANRSNEVSVAGEYYLYVEVCNAVGCVDPHPGPGILIDGPRGFRTEFLSPPAPPEKMTVGGAWEPETDAGLSRSVSPGDWESGHFDSIRLRHAPDDNGSPITGYAWEYRQVDADTGIVLFEDSGVSTQLLAGPGRTLATIQYFGHSTHPQSASGGVPWDIGVRVAAINAVGQAEWSDWDEWEDQRGSPPIIEIDSSTLDATCAIGDNCGTLNGHIKFMAPFQTYTFELMNYEELYANFMSNTVIPFQTVVAPVRQCSGSVTANQNGAGPFTITCDVGPAPTAIRLVSQESYLSGGSNIIDTVDPVSDPDPGLWHTFPS